MLSTLSVDSDGCFLQVVVISSHLLSISLSSLMKRTVVENTTIFYSFSLILYSALPVGGWIKKKTILPI